MADPHTPHHPVRRFSLLLTVLALSSALSAALSVMRIWYSDAHTYFFLNWNLLLAWAPLAWALVLWRISRRAYASRLLMLLLLAGWLIFFPNAPYIVSDLIHLQARDGVPLWYDAIMIFSFAWNGLILGFLSLWIVQQLVARWLGRGLSWVLVALTLGATGFGIYLGRFERWNSWDILFHPRGLARDVFYYALNPLTNPRLVGVTLLFAGFLLIAYLTLTLLPQALRGGSE